MWAKHNVGRRATGWVYVMTNAAMPGLVKIGRTARDPSLRAAELGRHTGVPHPFRLVGAIWTDDAKATEKAVHARLGAARVNGRREFFRCDPDEAVSAARMAAAETGGRWRDGGRWKRKAAKAGFVAKASAAAALVACAGLHSRELAALTAGVAAAATVSGTPRFVSEFLEIPHQVAGVGGATVCLAIAAGAASALHVGDLVAWSGFR